MKGGTYAEALKVGFTEDQAGYLARFGIQTLSETMDAVTIREHDRIVEERKRRDRIAQRRWQTVHRCFPLTACAIIFFVLGAMWKAVV